MNDAEHHAQQQAKADRERTKKHLERRERAQMADDTAKLTHRQRHPIGRAWLDLTAHVAPALVPWIYYGLAPGSITWPVAAVITAFALPFIVEDIWALEDKLRARG